MSGYYNSLIILNTSIEINSKVLVDFALGVCAIIIPLGYKVMLNKELIISSIDDVNKIGIHGGYIMHKNKTSYEALTGLSEETDKLEFTNSNRTLRPDEGTTGRWIFIYALDNVNYYNMYGIDNDNEFIRGIKCGCSMFSLNFNHYILGGGISPEGMVSDK